MADFLRSAVPDFDSYTLTIDVTVLLVDAVDTNVGHLNVFFGPFSISAFPSPHATTPTEGPNTQPGSGTLSTSTTYIDPRTSAAVSVAVDISFEQVTTSGQTTVTAFSSAVGVLGANFSVDVDGYQPTFVDVSTTAGVSGMITVCLGYADADNNGFVDGTGQPPTDPGIAESSLRILHREAVGGAPTFVDRTDTLDVVQNKICAKTTTWSPFVVAVNTTIPGGGSAKTDCISEWYAGRNVTFRKNRQPNVKIVCSDGQASCDTDGISGQCTFSIGICTNPTDPRLSKCTPSDIAAYTLTKPLPDSKDGTDAANGANILTELKSLGTNSVSGKHLNAITFSSPVTATACLDNPISVTVPLKKGKPGNKVIKLKAETSGGVIDTDALTLICNPSGP